MTNRTLTSLLFLRVFPVILVTLLIIGALAFNSTTHQINSVYDAQLINNAGVLWSLTEDEFNEQNTSAHKIDFDSDELNKNHDFSANDNADDYAADRMMRIWKDHTLIMYSDTAFPEDIPISRNGFSDVVYKKEKWRVFTLPITGRDISIEVGEKIILRKSLVFDTLVDLFAPLLLVIPAIGLLLWFGIGNGLKVIRALVQQIKDRSPDDLSPIDNKRLPLDLLPLALSINQLLLKLEESLTAERRFADHAAHQLRTPLAGLKLQLQMLAQTADETTRTQGIKNLLSSVDRATKLVNQLLNAVRVSHQPLNMKPVHLYRLVASVVADMGAMITAKNMNVSLDGNEKASVLADENLLRIAIVNIFENALKYTPSSGKIVLNIAAQETICSLTIQDSGPGIPQEHRESVFKRFYRIDEPSVEGAGLGLAIVSEIINRLSGKISLKSPPSGAGLLVEVLIPKG